MSTDRYTKFILTVIALSLTVLAADKIYDSLVPEAHASTSISCTAGGRYLSKGCTPVVIGK